MNDVYDEDTVETEADKKVTEAEKKYSEGSHEARPDTSETKA